jgi:predicted membrane channel-forming protein YqfA (hemolysin III family)
MPNVKDVAMNDLIDRVTRFLGSASNIIFVGHPMKTSLGVFVGLALSMFIKLFTPLLSNLSPVINFSAISDWEFIVIGIVLLHVGTIRYYLLKKGGILTEDEERVLAVIRAAKRQGMPQKAVTRMYLELCEQELAIANRGNDPAAYHRYSVTPDRP